MNVNVKSKAEMPNNQNSHGGAGLCWIFVAAYPSKKPTKNKPETKVIRFST